MVFSLRVVVDVILVLEDTVFSPPQLKLSANLGIPGPLYFTSIQRLSYHCFPCFSKSLFWQRLTNSVIATILSTTFRQEANICWTHWLSECWKEQHNQYVKIQQGLQGGSGSWRDEGWFSNGRVGRRLTVVLGLAIYYAHTANISHRLSWDRAGRQ